MAGAIGLCLRVDHDWFDEIYRDGDIDNCAGRARRLDHCDGSASAPRGDRLRGTAARTAKARREIDETAFV